MRKVIQTPISVSLCSFSNQLPGPDVLIPQSSQVPRLCEPQFCAEEGDSDGLSVSTDRLVIQLTAGQVNQLEHELGSRHSPGEGY